VHKALSAIALARWLEGLLDVPVVPCSGRLPRTTTGPRSITPHLIGVDNEVHRLALEPPSGADSCRCTVCASGRTSKAR
jgi:hypothetical protein